MNKEKKKLTNSELLNFQGTFSAVSNVSKIKKNKIDTSDQVSFIGPQLRVSVSPNYLDSLHKRVHISFPSRDTIQLIFKVKSVDYDTIKIGGKVSGGYFYLDNTFTKCQGVPYLLGGCQQEKTRITLSKKNDLIVQNAIDNSGAFLLIISSGYSYNVAYFYKQKPKE